jgi:hypothetical protein
MISSSNPVATSLEQLRKQIFKSKAERRRHWAQTPVVEKLRILEEMRDFTSALQAARDENKARVKGAWTSETEPGKVKCQRG